LPSTKLRSASFVTLAMLGAVALFTVVAPVAPQVFGVLPTTLVVSPYPLTNPVGGSVSITVTLYPFGSSSPAPAGLDVSFEITSGPNTAPLVTLPTDSSGQVTFTVKDTGGAGVDTFQVSTTAYGGYSSLPYTITWVPSGVPEFPIASLSSLLLIALLLPALFLMGRKFRAVRSPIV